MPIIPINLLSKAINCYLLHTKEKQKYRFKVKEFGKLTDPIDPKMYFMFGIPFIESHKKGKINIKVSHMR
jgi:hypothetical protein